ncbi:hypothetical protein [Streptomyces sp. LN785]|uniref:hypothetical protein n=1 Tax=Streptomyces sp. LN785 TaxID=3112983 RepID=UPI003721AD42
MRRGLTHALAWLLATGAAVTLSWWGVHTVMAGTAYDPPRAVPIAVSTRDGSGGAAALSSSTRRPAPPPSPTPSSSTPRTSVKPSAPPSRRPSRTPVSSRSPSYSTTPSGTVKSYPTDGGRVVLELGTDSAELVSATPAAGWSMQVWKQPAWIRVDFTTDDGRTVSVFCTWNDHPPMVEID